MGQGTILTTVDGKAVQVDQDNKGVFALKIDGVLHSSEGKSFPKAGEPVISLDFPFPSGSKKIEVFGKAGLLGYKCKLHIDGEFVKGDKF